MGYEHFLHNLAQTPGEMLLKQRERLHGAIEDAALRLQTARASLADLEERDRMLRASLREVEVAIKRLRLAPVAPSEARQNNDAA
jgi:hypothetical protein